MEIISFLVKLKVICMFYKKYLIFKNIVVYSVLLLSILNLTACSSKEDKANKFYENGIILLEKGELVKANIEFRNALQLNPKLGKAIWGQILITERQGNLSQQYKLLNVLLLNEPGNLQALVKMGRLLLAAGQLDKALEKSDIAMKINSKDISVLSLRSAVMYKLDDIPLAISFANQVLEKESSHADALMLLATERLDKGDARKALEFLEKGIVKNNRNVALQLLKIKTLESLSEIKLAEETQLQLIELYPNVNAFKNILANFYVKQKRNEDAEKVLRNIVERNPDDLKAKVTLIKLLSSIKGSDAGLKELQYFNEKEPRNEDLKFALVQFYVVRKEIETAKQLLTKIVNEDSDSDSKLKAKVIIASLFLMQGEKSTALKKLDDVLKIDKYHHDALILKSSINIDNQKYDEAISDLRAVLSNSPDSSKAMYYLAKAYSLSGLPELADEQYFKSFKSSKYNAVYGVSYAQFLLKRKQFNRAVKILHDVLSVSGDNLEALKLLAQTNLLLGDWVSAQDVANRIKRIDTKGDIANKISNAIMIGKKEYDESISLLKSTYISSPENIQPIVALVRTYMLAGKKQEAVNFLDAVIKASPKNTNAKILKAQVYASQGKKEDAINLYKEIINNEPGNISSYYQLSVVYMRAGEYQKAKEFLNKGLIISPNNFALVLTLAGIQEKIGEIENAIKLYEKLIKINPESEIVANNFASLLTESRTDAKSFDKAYNLSKRFKYSDVPQFKDTYGWASFRVGKYKDARQVLESVIKQSPNVPEFHYHLGMNFLAEKNKIKAREEFEKALELTGGDDSTKTEKIRTELEKL